MRRTFTRASLLAALAFFLSLGWGPGWADIRPKELEGGDGKEKKAEELEPALEGGKEAELHERLVREGENNLKEIQKLLDQVQKDLADKETGSSTQEKQKQVLERLEKLIKDLQDHRKG